MASLAMVSRCPPLRRISNTSSCVWLAAHLLLYFMLDLSTLAVLNASEVSSELPGASKVLVVALHVIIAVCWAAPWHGAALLLAAGALVLLRSWAGLQRHWFRMSAVAVFAAPALLLAFLLAAGDPATSLAVILMHVLMGLSVVQPRWPSAVPSMDQHRW